MKTLLVYAFLSIPLIGAFSMFALGIAVIYRASRVLNLSHGAMAMLPAYVFYSLDQAGVPRAAALFASLLAGAALGIGVERVFVRRLRPQGPTAQTVGTVAVTGLLIALAAKVWGTTPLVAPNVFPEGELSVAGAAVRYGDLGLFGVGIAVSGALFAFFRFTEVGLAMRGAAQNRRAAALMGIDPDLAASAAWALGGGLAALAGVLLAAVTSLDPYNLSLQVLPAFVAALIGGLESLLGAIAGAFVAGLAFGLVPALGELPIIGTIFRYSGATQLGLTVLALVVMGVRGKRFAGSDAADSGLKIAAAFERRRPLRFGPLAIAIAAGLVLWPFIAPFSVLGTTLLALELALAALSLAVLIGWVGQISLAQASFVGISALITGMVARDLGVGFPANVAIGAACAGVAAALLGVVALRVRGLYLAVATLIFAWMADQFLFPSPWLGAGTGSSTVPDQRLGTPGGYPSFDFTSRKTLYFIMLAVVVVVLAALANLRRTRTGRAFFAVRGSETAAASLGIDVTRYKLMAFALSGVLAGISGGLLMIEQRTVVPAQFVFTVSLQYLAIAVVGGLTSLSGAVAAGVLFAGLNELFFRVPALSGWLDVVSAGLLAFVLLVQPGGLAEAAHRWSRRARRLMDVLSPALARITDTPIASRLRAVGPSTWRLPPAAADWFAARATASRPDAEETDVPSEETKREPRIDLVRQVGSGSPDKADIKPRSERDRLLDAQGVTVRFGGLTAVDDASLAVTEGEIVGLIGPNGAGKTTLFNAILGFVTPASGTVALYGHDATSLPPHLRARLGVARTFQVLQLFNELTVFDNLLVASHIHNSSGVLSNLFASQKTIRAETEARERVHAVLELLELTDLERESVRGLPFGTLRIVELGRALVTGARLLMLDEIASGLNEAETDRLSELITTVRSLRVSVLLIEHDVRMVTSACDHIYVLNQGELIADGTPDQVRADRRVISAYLGEQTPVPSDRDAGEVALDA
jgi:ABC-type branched-subunit amino acid transport system ATPase component/branched-subunit amino acid ABC-type transport system permease component